MSCRGAPASHGTGAHVLLPPAPGSTVSVDEECIDGLPVGLQVVGPWGHDERVLDFAELCERALAGLVTARTAPTQKES